MQPGAWGRAGQWLTVLLAVAMLVSALMGRHGWKLRQTHVYVATRYRWWRISRALARWPRDRSW